MLFYAGPPVAVPTGEGQTDGLMSHTDKAKLDGIASSEQTLSNKTLSNYYETSDTLTSATGAVTIPLDGKIYQLTLSENITSITTSPPTAPVIGSAVVYIKQDGTGNRTMAYPATWYWSKGIATAIASDANSLSRLTLYSDPFGAIHADAETRSVPA